MHLPTASPGLAHLTCPHQEHLVTSSRTNLSAWGTGRAPAPRGVQPVRAVMSTQGTHLGGGRQQQGAGKTGLLCWRGQSRMHRSPCHSNFTITGHSAKQHKQSWWQWHVPAPSQWPSDMQRQSNSQGKPWNLVVGWQLGAGGEVDEGNYSISTFTLPADSPQAA